ncbi:MAG: substrate-binding periplasmic protein [Acidimicrobiia bacterium]
MKPVNKLWLVVLTLALITAACGGGTSATTATPETPDTTGAATGGLPDLGGQSITVAVENAYPPFNFIDEATGQPAGWDYDAINEICSRINCTPEFVEVAWDGMIIAVSQGQYDMAADGITITDEREEQVDFSQGYVHVDQRLLARIDEDRFANTDEFAEGDYLVATQLGTTNFATAVAVYGEDRVQGFEQFGFAVQAVINGDADAVIIDSTAGQGYEGENAEAVKMIEGSLVSDELGFIFPPDSELVAAFDAALDSMREDGTLESINNTWWPAQ